MYNCTKKYFYNKFIINFDKYYQGKNLSMYFWERAKNEIRIIC